MIRLNLKREPYWLDLLPGLRLRVLPCTTAVMSAATTSPAMRALPPDADPERRFVALAVEVAKVAVLDWEGIGDEAGEPDPEVTPEKVAALMDIYAVAQAFAARYLAAGLQVSAEKNV